jgi:hypothetical protein
VNVQGGFPANVELPPELGVHPTIQEPAKLPAAPNWNSNQLPPTVMGSARADDAVAKMAPTTTTNINIFVTLALNRELGTSVIFWGIDITSPFDGTIGYGNSRVVEDATEL